METWIHRERRRRRERERGERGGRVEVEGVKREREMKQAEKGREFTTQNTHNIDSIHTSSQNKACSQLPSASPTH